LPGDSEECRHFTKIELSVFGAKPPLGGSGEGVSFDTITRVTLYIIKALHGKASIRGFLRIHLLF